MSNPGDPPMTAEEKDSTSTMPEKAEEVVGEAGEKVQEAAATAQDKLRDELDQRSTKAGETAADTAKDLRTVGEELRKQGKETPARIADKAAEQTERLGSYLKEADGDRMLSDIEDFGRRRPLAVLGGGMIVGIAAARFLKASSRDRYRSKGGHGSPEEVTRELGTEAPVQPRGASERTAQESARQAPVPSGVAGS